MKRYIRSSYNYEPEFLGHWSEEDKAIWKSVDWKARNYEDYIVEDDTIEGRVRFVGTDYGWVPATFVKHIWANPRYDPHYAPIEEGRIKEILDKGGIVGPMYDGDSVNGYRIHNRYETSEVYDMLSR